MDGASARIEEIIGPKTFEEVLQMSLLLKIEFF